MTALVSAGVHHGYGLHLDDIKDTRDREQALMYTYVAPSISIVASTFGKISMVLFLVRLLGYSAKRRHIWFLYSVTVIMVGLNVFAIGVLLGGCSPMQKAWIPTTPGTCIAPDIFEYGGRVQSSKGATHMSVFGSLTNDSMECHHGLDHSIISRLHGMEASDEEKHKVGIEFLDVWWHFVGFPCIAKIGSQ